MNPQRRKLKEGTPIFTAFVLRGKGTCSCHFRLGAAACPEGDRFLSGVAPHVVRAVSLPTPGLPLHRDHPVLVQEDSRLGQTLALPQGSWKSLEGHAGLPEYFPPIPRNTRPGQEKRCTWTHKAELHAALPPDSLWVGVQPHLSQPLIGKRGTRVPASQGLGAETCSGDRVCHCDAWPA